MKKYQYHFSIFQKGGEPIDIYLTAKNDQEAWDKIGSIVTIYVFPKVHLQSKEEVEF